MALNGEIVSGEFDSRAQAFILQKVKHFSTETILSKKQLNALFDYLTENRREEDGQVLTLYDQVLVRLNQEEVEQFINDLDTIKSRFQ
ncbi:MAG TPA: hypothetical protein VK097_00700 [Lentibacillus sp.]|uniref:hypothetical protein n=1 Tax=Lentibacillus sp. TaxID=1925746 RepID=UPI002B4B7F90|nr:hypothetical protein [Lentibacillus sp.]HLR60942.1 hypothetical protein [Lentibacillus sp.]